MDIFTNFKSAIKIREVHIDNKVFELHYRVTAILLLGCTALVASKQHFGDPIDCITRDDVPSKIMDTYCWIHATFTLPDACNRTVGLEVAHPCVDKSDHTKEERVYHKYYQWVYFVLFFQALCFYAPHFMWKSCEGLLIKKLCGDLRGPLMVKNKARKKLVRNITTYLLRARTENRTRHQTYYYYFVFFEVLNFVNVLFQVYIVDAFLGGTFTTYGLDVLNYIQMDQDERADPMARVFPKMTKCTFHRFGSSGDVQRHDALCILPLNIINEKIYIIMWFWFAFLACVTGLWLVYRLMTFMKPKMRYSYLRRRANFAQPSHLRVVLRDASPGEWFVLTMICKNTDCQWFRYIIKKFSILMKKSDRLQRNGFRLGKNSSAMSQLEQPEQSFLSYLEDYTSSELDEEEEKEDAEKEEEEESDSQSSDDEQEDAPVPEVVVLDTEQGRNLPKRSPRPAQSKASGEGEGEKSAKRM